MENKEFMNLEWTTDQVWDTQESRLSQIWSGKIETIYLVVRSNTKS